MSALGIGIAWLAMGAAAFKALSAIAPARTRHDLETGAGAAAGSGGLGDALLVADGGGALQLAAPRPSTPWWPPTATQGPGASERWPQFAHTATTLRSSPSVLGMTASPSRPGRL